jgi:HSP20 family molecular chaperone IbpA
VYKTRTQADQIEASFENGVLIVQVGFPEQKEPESKRIPVSTKKTS